MHPACQSACACAHGVWDRMQACPEDAQQASWPAGGVTCADTSGTRTRAKAFMRACEMILDRYPGQHMRGQRRHSICMAQRSVHGPTPACPVRPGGGPGQHVHGQQRRKCSAQRSSTCFSRRPDRACRGRTWGQHTRGQQRHNVRVVDRSHQAQLLPEIVQVLPHTALWSPSQRRREGHFMVSIA